MIPKFRAWDIENKKMYDCYGFDVLNERIYRCNLADAEFRAGHLETIYAVEDDLDNFELMQSTGLKDKNGVEIFEGDIVILTSKSINYAYTYWHNYAEVFKQPNGAYRLRGKGIYETELYGNRKQVTLTGNVYETPELLENDRFCTETDDPDY